MRKLKTYKNWNSYTIIIVFLFVIMAPTIQRIIPFVSYGDLVRNFDEKRDLAKMPKFNLDSINKFPAQFNDYVNDNFEFREWFVAWNNYIKVKNLKVSPLENVTLGSGDWMFLTYDGVAKNIEGKALFSQGELENIKARLEEKRDYLHQLGSSFYLVIGPNKSTIYPEYLPYYINVSDNSRTDQLLEYLKKNSTIKVIEIKDKLLEAKAKNQLYYKTDSHWNHNGSFICYMEIMKTLKKDYPELPVYSKSDFDVTPDTMLIGGDISIMLALKNEYRQVSYNYRRKEYMPQLSNYHSKEYQIFEDPGHNPTTVIEAPDTTLLKIINFHDSFSGFLWDFIPLNFSKSVFVWTHEFRKEIIEKEKPDIVIYTIVERDIHLLGKQ